MASILARSAHQQPKAKPRLEKKGEAVQGIKKIEPCSISESRSFSFIHGCVRCLRAVLLSWRMRGRIRLRCRLLGWPDLASSQRRRACSPRQFRIHSRRRVLRGAHLSKSTASGCAQTPNFHPPSNSFSHVFHFLLGTHFQFTQSPKILPSITQTAAAALTLLVAPDRGFLAMASRAIVSSRRRFKRMILLPPTS